MKFRDSQPENTAELELAPMIDVVFLLLIFFIVSWRFAKFEEDMDFSVPAAEELVQSKGQVGEIIVNVAADGSIILNSAVITLPALYKKLAPIAETFPSQAVILRSHADTELQSVINALDQIKKAGIKNVVPIQM